MTQDSAARASALAGMKRREVLANRRERAIVVRYCSRDLSAESVFGRRLAVRKSTVIILAPTIKTCE